MKHVIVGYGQIGKAIHGLFPSADCYDLDSKLMDTSCDFMHVCFPFSDAFKSEVARYQGICNPVRTIVYSTVPIGTCSDLEVIHSPVEGKHPDLEMSMRFFERWIGASDREAALSAAGLFMEIGIRTRVVNNSNYTEALKLLSTAEYGINIVFAGYKAKVAKALEMPYELTKDWNREYNKLYRNLGLGNRYQKYVLDEPEGPIGGHCVVPNAELLANQASDRLLDLIMEYGHDI